MSYDVYLTIGTGGDEPASVGESFNHTWNCSMMFCTALGGNGINDLHGRLAADVIRPLEDAVRNIAEPENRAAYQAMNPPNKWGSHESAAKFLSDILAECRKHPKARLTVC